MRAVLNSAHERSGYCSGLRLGLEAGRRLFMTGERVLNRLLCRRGERRIFEARKRLVPRARIEVYDQGLQIGEVARSRARLILSIEQEVTEADNRVCARRRIYESRWGDVELAVRAARAKRDAVRAFTVLDTTGGGSFEAGGHGVRVGRAHERAPALQGCLADAGAGRCRRPRAFCITGAVRESGGPATTALDALEDAWVAGGTRENRAGGLGAGRAGPG